MTITKKQLVEMGAEAAYARFKYDEPQGEKPAWVPNGNSLKQDDARDYSSAVVKRLKVAEMVEALGQADSLIAMLERLCVEYCDEYSGTEVEAWCNQYRALLASLEGKTDD